MNQAVVRFISAVSFLGAVLQTFGNDQSTLSLKDVAGDYYFGDGTGVNCTLTLTKQGTFAFKWRGCLGTYDENNGDASIAINILHITPKKPNMQEGFKGTPTDFFAVRWGARMYLIPTNQIVEFCSDVNQGSEPRKGNWGEYYLRRDDWDKGVTGIPAVPKAWTLYLLSKPVHGKIIEVMGRQEAWLNLGTQEGILPGMVLIAQDHGKLMFSQVRVETVETNRCRIRCEWRDSMLELGQTVSTRFHD